MSFDERSGETVLFGGGVGPLLGDTWSWDGIRWRRVAESGPASRAWAGMAYDEAIQQIVLFGGEGVAGQLDDTWTWDGGWRQQQPASTPPGGGHAAMAGGEDGAVLVTTTLTKQRRTPEVWVYS